MPYLCFRYPLDRGYGFVGHPSGEVRSGIIQTRVSAVVKEKYGQVCASDGLLIQQWGTPEDVAEAVSMFCNGKLGYCSGQSISVDGGFTMRRIYVRDKNKMKFQWNEASLDHRNALLYATGAIDEDVKRPIIGIMHASKEVNPGRYCFSKIVEEMRQIIYDVGGCARALSVIDICANCTGYSDCLYCPCRNGEPKSFLL